MQRAISAASSIGPMRTSRSRPSSIRSLTPSRSTRSTDTSSYRVRRRPILSLRCSPSGTGTASRTRAHRLAAPICSHLPQGFCGVDQLLGRDQELASFFGQSHRLGAALDEARPEMVFERAHLVRSAAIRSTAHTTGIRRHNPVAASPAPTGGPFCPVKRVGARCFGSLTRQQPT
jgi:hypothetical protein